MPTYFSAHQTRLTLSGIVKPHMNRSKRMILSPGSSHFRWTMTRPNPTSLTMMLLIIIIISMSLRTAQHTTQNHADSCVNAKLRENWCYNIIILHDANGVDLCSLLCDTKVMYIASKITFTNRNRFQQHNLPDGLSLINSLIYRQSKIAQTTG